MSDYAYIRLHLVGWFSEVHSVPLFKVAELLRNVYQIVQYQLYSEECLVCSFGGGNGGLVVGVFA